MNTKELVEGNYMEALLRAAILLGDLHRAVPVREIMISGFVIRNHTRRLYPRCKIVAQMKQQVYPVETVLPEPPGENYLILYPIWKTIPS